MKQTIRQEMRARRRALSDAVRRAASAVICDKLLADATVRAALRPETGARGVVAVYLASPQEIDLTPFIQRMLADGVPVAAPRWNGANYDLAALKGLTADCLREGPMGIAEPKDAEFVAPRAVAVWLVPGLAFTRDGGRLGYGGGWYDRLLADAAATALKLGVAHTFQIVAALPTEPHDRRLTGVVDDDGAADGKGER